MSASEGKYFNYENRPWLKFYEDIPHSIDYPDCNMYEMVRNAANKNPKASAYDFMSTTQSYGEFMFCIDGCADALSKRNLKKGDVIAIALPNIPQALSVIYAANKLGCICVMIHPLSSPNEFELFIRETEPKMVVTLNLLYEKFRQVIEEAAVPVTLLCKINDTLRLLEKWAVDFKYRGRGKVKSDGVHIIYWKDFIKEGERVQDTDVYNRPVSADEAAVILYSGGTTGEPKGMVLSSKNFNALACQLIAQFPFESLKGKSMVAILPIFHGFGLGCCVHAMLSFGLKTILVPRFGGDAFAGIISKKHPALIAGAPTMFEALLRNNKMKHTDLSCLIGAFSGGDRLPRDLKERFDKFLRAHGANISLREGYGLTETVTACVLTPENEDRVGSVGIPFPDMLVKICKPGTCEEEPVGTDGEICLFGPTVMLGYTNDLKGTAKALISHPDGRTWLHTGDMGCVDDDGFLYFKQRIKRILKISGYTIYPSFIEDIVNTHPAVQLSCAVAMHDDIKMSRVKLFVSLNPGYRGNNALRGDIMAYCKQHLNVWSVPKEIEFLSEMPLTKVGKVDYKVLEGK